MLELDSNIWNSIDFSNNTVFLSAINAHLNLLGAYEHSITNSKMKCLDTRK